MIVGWDIGGVNTKMAVVRDGAVVSWHEEAFELQRDPAGLVSLLTRLASSAGVVGAAAVHAVTMTAELSQMFRTKREGVGFVLDAVEQAFPESTISVYAVDGRFLTAADARARPLAVAAANWAAAARVVAGLHPDAVLIDVGTTTSDVIPIEGGQLRPSGWTDPARFASGELVYAGALRTPVEALVSSVPFGDGRASVSAEGFALAGDVHVWRGDLDPADYSVTTPDGRPPTRAFAGERLARIVCADREMVDPAAISAIADAVADAQTTRLADAVGRVRARVPSIETAVVTGLGAFIAARAARLAGLRVVFLQDEIGPAARCAPAVAVASLLEGVALTTSPAAAARYTRPLTVVKVGGGLMASPAALEAVLDTIAAAPDERLLIVPGGGVLADAVRNVDQRFQPGDSTAHWMAVLAMDQLAHLIAARLPRGVVIDDPAHVASTLDAGRLPVIAPYRWLRGEDPLPHGWDVTSDSIAAWIAGRLHAARLVLVKPAGAAGDRDALTDAAFPRVVPASVEVHVVPADALAELAAALRSTRAAEGIFAVAGRMTRP